MIHYSNLWYRSFARDNIFIMAAWARLSVINNGVIQLGADKDNFDIKLCNNLLSNGDLMAFEPCWGANEE